MEIAWKIIYLNRCFIRLEYFPFSADGTDNDDRDYYRIKIRTRLKHRVVVLPPN